MSIPGRKSNRGKGLEAEEHGELTVFRTGNLVCLECEVYDGKQKK